MPNQNIFCITPWYELHIYWDGSLGICCTERHKLYPADQLQQYNIANMSIREWFNSEPVREFRQQVLGNQKNSACQRCYKEEALGGHSRRLKSNIKAAIFSKAFDQSFEQSPVRVHFVDSGYVDNMPIDMHIDLGNHCNLACKMCNAESSSKIAVQEVKWGIESSRKFVGQDWTANDATWEKFKNELLEIPKLSNIHFMGGETLMSNRIEDLVDFLTQHGRFEVGFSLVTNGTLYRPDLVKKMSRFKRVNIEISIESITKHNDYVRQGTDTAQVISNIEKYHALCNDIVDITLRPAISALSIGTFYTLLQYALDKKIVIKPCWCIRPEWLDPVILPNNIKQQYIARYQQLLAQLSHVDTGQDVNASDRNNVEQMVSIWTKACITSLSTPAPVDADQHLSTLVKHCNKWDKVYKLSVDQLYPEFVSLFEKYGQ